VKRLYAQAETLWLLGRASLRTSRAAPPACTAPLRTGTVALRTRTAAPGEEAKASLPIRTAALQVSTAALRTARASLRRAKAAVRPRRESRRTRRAAVRMRRAALPNRTAALRMPRAALPIGRAARRNGRGALPGVDDTPLEPRARRPVCAAASPVAPTHAPIRARLVAKCSIMSLFKVPSDLRLGFGPQTPTSDSASNAGHLVRK
jgi:hypothetical protein